MGPFLGTDINQVPESQGSRSYLDSRGKFTKRTLRSQSGRNVWNKLRMTMGR